MSYIFDHVKILRVLDGDTVELEIDIGFGAKFTDKFRLVKINAPEKNMPGGTEATERLKEILANGVTSVETYKKDKFGRWLVRLNVSSGGGEMDVNQMMLNESHAVPYM